MKARFAVARWAALLALAVAGAWAAYRITETLVTLRLSGPPEWLWLLLKVYGCLALGYAYGALGSRLAPTGRYVVAVGFVILAAIVAAALMLRPDLHAVRSAIMGLALVGGAVGHALRVRGFTERPGWET